MSTYDDEGMEKTEYSIPVPTGYTKDISKTYVYKMATAAQKRWNDKNGETDND